MSHISGKNGNGSYAVRRAMVRKRMREKLQEIKQQPKMRMHDENHLNVGNAQELLEEACGEDGAWQRNTGLMPGDSGLSVGLGNHQAA
jgi:hypothetical protein